MKKFFIVVLLLNLYLSDAYSIQPDVFVQSTVNRASKILSKNILAPILDITDPRNDKRLAFIDGTHSLEEIESKVDSKEFKAAFILKPISVGQIKEVANKGESMPPKSTYIQPKLRSGMLIYDLID